MLEGAEQSRSGRMPWAQNSVSLRGFLGGMHDYQDDDDDPILAMMEVRGGWRVWHDACGLWVVNK